MRPHTNLHIGEEQTVVSADRLPSGNSTVVMPIGRLKSGREFFRHDPPTALEIERAIDAVEEELLRIGKSVVVDSTLCTSDETIWHIAAVAGLDLQRETVLSRQLVEQTFDRLAALSMGRPLAQDRMPTNPEFAITLLILREFMHHLQFSSITVTN